jgi:hypothetical protein
VWTERSATDCCVVVWQISVGVESCDTAQQVWLITLWGGRGKMDRGWWQLYVTDDLG